MYWFYDFYDQINSFFDLGGPVLWVIAGLLLVMWSFIFERVWYFCIVHRALVQKVVNNWNNRSDIKSWQAHKIREATISKVKLSIDQNLRVIKVFVKLCPLLGLLGTVTGMINVFDILAITGGSDIRSMASGVSRATIPTMAGMVAALSGMFASIWLSRKAEREKSLIQDYLIIER